MNCLLLLTQDFLKRILPFDPEDPTPWNIPQKPALLRDEEPLWSWSRSARAILQKYYKTKKKGEAETVEFILFN